MPIKNQPHARCSKIYFLYYDNEVPRARIEKNFTTGLTPENSSSQFKVVLDILPAQNITIPLTVTPTNPSSGSFFHNIPYQCIVWS